MTRTISVNDHEMVMWRRHNHRQLAAAYRFRQTTWQHAAFSFSIHQIWYNLRSIAHDKNKNNDANKLHP